MDWSLLQPHANKRFLRDVRGFKNKYWYYLVMILNLILRFDWIFYSIYTQDLQDCPLVNFLVGFSEVSRRGLWTLFRVENEHCSNVARFKAFRDIPLPYKLETSLQESLSGNQGVTSPGMPAGTASSIRRHGNTSAGLEIRLSLSEFSIRRRPLSGLTFSKILADAHTQDFEKRVSAMGDSGSAHDLERSDSLHEDGRTASSDDYYDEDDKDIADIFEVYKLLRDADDVERG